MWRLRSGSGSGCSCGGGGRGDSDATAVAESSDESAAKKIKQGLVIKTIKKQYGYEGEGESIEPRIARLGGRRPRPRDADGRVLRAPDERVREGQRRDLRRRLL